MALITLLYRPHRPNTFYGMGDQNNGQNWLHGVEVRNSALCSGYARCNYPVSPSDVCTSLSCD
jgi:hypothetical protein